MLKNLLVAHTLPLKYPATLVIGVVVVGVVVSPVDVYPKYAVLSYIANPEDFTLTLSASNVDIGNVGIIDHSTGNDVYAQITQIDTIGITRVGAVAVKTYGVSPVSGNVTATILEQVPEIYTFHNLNYCKYFHKLNQLHYYYFLILKIHHKQ